jgi:uncharacterized membrane protein YeaQ/YmgE (transglycosylase-associated protein family)
VSNRDPETRAKYESQALGLAWSILAGVVGAVIGLLIGRRTTPIYLAPDFTPITDAVYGFLIGAAVGLAVYAAWKLWRRRGAAPRA